MCKELALEEAIDLWLNKTMKMNESAVAQPGTQLGRGGGGVMAPPRQAQRKGQENGRQNVKTKQNNLREVQENSSSAIF